MKVVIIGPAWPYRGGIADFNERLATEMNLGDYDVSLVTFTLQYPKLLFPGKTQFSDKAAPADLVIRRLISSINPLSWFRTGRKLRSESPDIIIFRYWIPFLAPAFGTIARIVRKNRKTKVLCIFDNVIPHEKRVGDTLLTKFFTHAVDGGIVMASSVADDLRKFRPDIPVTVTPHPLFDSYGEPMPREEALSKLSLDPSCRYILFFGFIRKYKGLDLLLDAFRCFLEERKGVKLIIAGEFYEKRDIYLEKINKPGVAENMILLDRYISGEEIPQLFCASDLIVQPYRSATQSGVTQVAYFFDKPMLVTNVGGLKEIVLHNKGGYVVEPDSREIQKALIDFFEKNRLESMTAEVRREKGRFGWPVMVQRIGELIRIL